MRKIRWVNPKKTVCLFGLILYLLLLGNITVQSFLGQAVDNLIKGSTIYCYQEGVDDAWWQNRK